MLEVGERETNRRSRLCVEIGARWGRRARLLCLPFREYLLIWLGGSEWLSSGLRGREMRRGTSESDGGAELAERASGRVWTTSPL